MKTTKLVYIVSGIDKAIAFEWLAVGLRNKIDVCFILISKRDSAFSLFLREHSIRYHEIIDEQYPSRLGKWFRVLLILIRERPTTVHTHLWQANLLGISAAWLLRIKQRVYTRHHATVHYREFPSGRKWDILCNHMATKIVAISENVKMILVNLDKADVNKIKLIHHGFDFDYFRSVTGERIEALRTKYNLPKVSSPIVGVISRYLQWKGVHLIIPAFIKIKEQYPFAKLVLANAHGKYQPVVKELLQALPADSYVEIRFEEDLASLYQLFDVFVHVPVDSQVEAFGQIYIEALASGTPSVFTMSGIAPEFIVHNENALVVPFNDSESIYDSVIQLMEDVKLRNHLIANGKESVGRFSMTKMINQLEQIYES